jgi:hypothetical protein
VSDPNFSVVLSRWTLRARLEAGQPCAHGVGCAARLRGDDDSAAFGRVRDVSQAKHPTEAQVHARSLARFATGQLSFRTGAGGLTYATSTTTAAARRSVCRVRTW